MSTAARPAQGVDTAIERPRWSRGDIFRAVLFGMLGIVYVILLFPLAVLTAILWAVSKVVESTSARPPASRG
jgi:hypothetical protein